MASKNAIAQFTCRWKIDWTEFNELSTKNVTKSFVTACNNVVLHWKTVLSTKTEKTAAGSFSFFLHYDDGHADELNGLCVSVDLMKSGKIIETCRGRKMRTSADSRGSKRGWSNFDVKHAKLFQLRHNLVESEPLYYQITLKIPISIFSFSENVPTVVDPAPWLSTAYQQIEDADKAIFSNAKLISRDGRIFYCHRTVLEMQSEVLAAFFRHPPADNTDEGAYDFPALSTNGLRALLEFLYTGRATLIDLSTNEVLEVADTAEQYGFKILKQMCLAFLWKRCAGEPEGCFDVVRFSDLHQDWKYLKHRAMDVLSDEFENLSLHMVDLKERFGGGEIGERLRNEFILYVRRRLEPCFAVEGN